MPGELNTSLAHPLYAMLGWQALVLGGATAALFFGWWALQRRRPRVAVDHMVEPRGRKYLRIGLGVLWLVDGLLQAQPAMPSGFIQQVLAPQLNDAPDWLYGLVDPFARLWLQHPVAADAITVWVQIGLGVGILVGGRGLWARAVLLGSIAWAGFVWVFGELLGGLTDPAVSWLTGAPGAALLYVVGAVLLLLRWSAWESGSAALWARRSVGATFLLGAVLQALPRGGYWTAKGLPGLLDDAARGGLPGPLAAPVQWLGQAIPSFAGVVNADLVLVLAVVGLGLLLGVAPRSLTVAAAVVCFLGWWFGQAFGVFGGLGTDPNTGAVLLVLLVGGWPGWTSAPAEEPVRDDQPAGERTRRVSALVGAAAFAALLVLPVVALVGMLGPPSAMAAIGDSGGIAELSPQAAPAIALTDQHGKPLALRDLRGDLVLVSFLDPVCFDNCPLMANQMATAIRLLGRDGRSVQILAVDVNPTFNAVADVKTFTDEHGLATLPNWHFVTGSTQQVGAVLAAYGQSVSVPRVGMIGHPQAVYLVGRDGTALAVLDDSANEDLTQSYAQLLAQEVRRHL